MIKKISIFLLGILVLTACSSEEKRGVRFQNTNKMNYNDIKGKLKDDPNYSGAEKQNPDEFKKEDKGAVAKKEEYDQVTGENGLMDKDELNKKRDQDIKDGIINISDGIFLPLVNDIYINKDEYIGKKVRIIGQVVKFTDPDTKEVVYAVLREGPGCCYNDSVIGFEFLTDGEYPGEKKWVEMVGEVILDNYGAGKVVKLKALEFKETEPKSKKIIHLNQ